MLAVFRRVHHANETANCTAHAPPASRPCEKGRRLSHACSARPSGCGVQPLCEGSMRCHHPASPPVDEVVRHVRRCIVIEGALASIYRSGALRGRRRGGSSRPARWGVERDHGSPALGQLYVLDTFSIAPHRQPRLHHQRVAQARAHKRPGPKCAIRPPFAREGRGRGLGGRGCRARFSRPARGGAARARAPPRGAGGGGGCSGPTAREGIGRAEAQGRAGGGARVGGQVFYFAPFGAHQPKVHGRSDRVPPLRGGTKNWHTHTIPPQQF